MTDYFLKVNKRNGKNKTCKFCHAEVWWHKIEGRWYEPGGAILHVENCERRRKHYSDHAAEQAEAQRRKRK